MNISEIMTPQVDMIDANTTIRDAAQVMRDDDVGALPVSDDGRLIGMVTDRDIVARGVATDGLPGNITVRQVMSEGLYSVREGDSVEDAAGVMAEHKVRRLPVLNPEDRLAGLVSLADLVHRAGPEMAARALGSVTEPMPHAPRA